MCQTIVLFEKKKNGKSQLTLIRNGTARPAASHLSLSDNVMSVTIYESGAPGLAIGGPIPCALIVGDSVELEWQCAGPARV
jgi:hypothetical protein